MVCGWAHNQKRQVSIYGSFVDALRVFNNTLPSRVRLSHPSHRDMGVVTHCVDAEFHHSDERGKRRVENSSR